MSGLTLFTAINAWDLILKLAVTMWLWAVITMIAKACPDISEYIRDGLLQDVCHLATFSIGVFICHLAVSPANVGGHQRGDNSMKIRVPLYLL
mmetsp:Transcript_2616/g.6140  ORF Transcript_2616/g.6140 Transcript_2616/m.6140 type:complete len:93 (-) Transcript_2616:59-337(-)